MSKKTRLILSTLLGIIISVIFLRLLLVKIPWEKLGETLLHIQWWWCVPAPLLYLLGHYLRGLRCALILRPHKRVSSFRATQVVLIGYAANNLLPARLGELVRGYALGKQEDIPQGTAISTVFVERIFDGLAIVGILAGVCLVSPMNSWIHRAGWLGGIIFVGALSVLLMARLWKKQFYGLISLFSRFLPRSLQSKIEGFCHRLIDGTDCLQWNGSLLGIGLLSFLIWLVEGSMFLVLLPAFGLPASLPAAYLAMSITNLGVLLPSSPGHVGTFHFFCANALLAAGLVSNPSLGLGYAMVVHAFQYVPVTLLGLAALYSYGFNLRTVWSLSSDPTSKQPAVCVS